MTELVVCFIDTIAHWGVVGPGSSRELSNVKANGEAQVAALAEAQQANTTLQSQMVRSLYPSRPCMMLMSIGSRAQPAGDFAIWILHWAPPQFLLLFSVYLPPFSFFRSS